MFIKPYDIDFKSFLFDDGWDDSASLWGFNKGFPHGFTNITKLASDYNAGIEKKLLSNINGFIKDELYAVTHN